MLRSWLIAYPGTGIYVRLIGKPGKLDVEENTEIYCVSKILVNSEFVFALFSVSIFSESPPVHHYAKLLCYYTQT